MDFSSAYYKFVGFLPSTIEAVLLLSLNNLNQKILLAECQLFSEVFYEVELWMLTSDEVCVCPPLQSKDLLTVHVKSQIHRPLGASEAKKRCITR